MTEHSTPQDEAEALTGPERRPLPKKIWIGASIVLVFILMAALAPWIAPHDPIAQDIPNRFANPGAGYLLGTDELGRDVLSRLIHAGRIDLPVGFLAAFLPMVLGTVFGLLAGYFGRWVDTIVMRTADLIQAFPIYIFLIAIVFALGSGVRSILIAFTAVAWVLYARLIRGEVLRIRNLDYMQAARGLGLSHLRIIFRHVLPNAGKQTVIYFMSDIVLAIVTLAALSYFGLGIRPPTADWGAMIADGQPFLRTQWWLAVLPGVVIVVFGTGLSLIADGLDDHMRDA